MIQQKKYKILLVEDDVDYARIFSKQLSRVKGQLFEIENAVDFSSARQHLRAGDTDIIILDFGLPDIEGLEALKKLHVEYPEIPIIVMTGQDDEELALTAMREGAQEYFLKGEIDIQLLERVIRYSVERKQVENSLRKRERFLVNQNHILLELAKSKALNEGDVNGFIQEITESAVNTLSVERASVWLYEKDRTAILCEDLFIAKTQAHSRGRELSFERHPSYFETLEDNRFIAADDACTDIRTKEFAKSYLIPEGITSLLDAPIRLRGETVGVICYEHCGEPRQWTVEEQHFAASLADLVALAVECRERKAAEARVNHLAYHDTLTDLPNRVLFIDRLHQAIISSRRSGKELAVMVLDLDRFKRINDTLGHTIGDELLQQLAVRLKNTLYETDTLTRIGGDEFAILIPELKRSGDAIKVAEKIFMSLKEPFFVGGHELFSAGSMGIAIAPSDGHDGMTLLKNADTALHQAKEKGRNNYRLYSSTMSVRAFEHLILENSLRRALEKDELEVYYQPQINSLTGKVVQVEALLRWNHPHLGMVGPAEFIPIAEETGLIVPIGEWVMREACKQLKAWRAAGFNSIGVAVNLSERQFNYANVVEVVRKVLNETGVEAEFLELELTESMIMKNVDETIKTLSQLKEMGVQISIDDFGTGHSSLSYLKRFPLDCLKIDRSFISELSEDSDDAAIAKAIISMAHNLKLRVIAEGVESQEQMDFLRLNNCDMMQGYSISRPVAASHVEKFFFMDALPEIPRQAIQ